MTTTAEQHWAILLLRILSDIEAGKLSTRFSAVEVRAGGDQLIIYSPELREQISYEGYLNRDIDALGSAGYFDVSFSGVDGRDVVVRQRAFEHKKELTTPGWKKAARGTVPQGRRVITGAVLVVAGAVLGQFGTQVVWPWLSGFLRVGR